MTEIRKELLDELLEDYKTPEDLIGQNGLLKQLTKRLLERAMDAEMDVHLGYKKHDPAGYNSGNSRPGLFEFLDRLPREAWPTFLRGDSGFGNQGTIVEAESRGLDYLFKLRQTSKVKKLIEEVFLRSDWSNAGQGWEGTESRLQLTGWTSERRVIVLRRELKGQILLKENKDKSQPEFAFMDTLPLIKKYEYAVLVTSLTDEILTIAQHYRDRADSENVFDELKNQWGWLGFTTQDLHRCQIMARNTALIYNWWLMFVRLVIPDYHAEAITSRPLLLNAVGRQIRHAGQTKITVTNTHRKSKRFRKILYNVISFLRSINDNAEQLDWCRDGA